GAELAKPLDDAEPKVILSASCGIEPNRVVEYKPLLDRAFELARHAPDSCIIYQRDALCCELTPGRDLDWIDLLAEAAPVDCVPVKATDPLYILYTSGTTGTPKGVRSEEHTSELQSRFDLVCRLLLEKKNNTL